MKLDAFDYTLIGAFFIGFAAVIFSAKLGVTPDAFKAAETVVTTTLGVFVGKKMPSNI